MAALNRQQLVNLWVNQGGDPKYAGVMANLALRESGGNPLAHNTKAPDNSYGLWQINVYPGANTDFAGQAKSGRLFTPAGNAKAAMAILRRQGLTAWSTYNPSVDAKYIGKGAGAPSAAPVGRGAGRPASAASSPTVPGGINKDLLTQFVLAGGADNSSAVQGLASGMQASAAKPVSVKSVKAPSAPTATGGSGPTGKTKIVAVKAPWNPANKPVGDWMVPILNWAHQHGWTGTVTSGYRNPAEQMQAARNYGLQHYGPGGPLASNHVSGNAVDVTQPAQLAKVLQGYTGPGKLVWGGPVIGDTPHFSQNGH